MNFQETSYVIESRRLTLNFQLRLLFIDRVAIKLTPTECQLMLCFIHGAVARDETLVSKLTKMNMMNLEKHIINLRMKIRPYGLSIHRVHSYGYILAGRK